MSCKPILKYIQRHIPNKTNLRRLYQNKQITIHLLVFKNIFECNIFLYIFILVYIIRYNSHIVNAYVLVKSKYRQNDEKTSKLWMYTWKRFEFKKHTNSKCA
jgi:hypothetical protein